MSTSTLLLTLAGPQQAWGTSSRFTTRSTERAPTRSGVLGLVAAAFGWDRTEPLDRFTVIRFGVRVDHPGKIERDFQTARRDDGSALPLSQRHYLADAAFLAGLESDDTQLLREIEQAIRRPRYPLYLGRRAFPPAGPIATSVVDSDLRTAMSQAPWKPRGADRRRTPQSLDLLLDAEPGAGVDFSVEDDPISFDPRRRQHGWRDIQIVQVTPPGMVAISASADPRPPRPRFSPPAHDPMLLVSEEEV